MPKYIHTLLHLFSYTQIRIHVNKPVNKLRNSSVNNQVSACAYKSIKLYVH